MAFNDGDFVRIDYSAWRIADGKLIYTTSRKLAEENGILDEDAAYVPQLVIVGKESVIKGIESAVRLMSVSETKKLEIEPKDAFGEKNPDLVKVLPLGDFKKRDISPYPGMRLDIDNAIATVKSVNSGRVVVDANHPLAGERLTYEIRVVDKLETDADRAKALAETFSLKPDLVSVDGGKMNLKFGKDVEKNPKYMVNKSDLVNSILKYMEKVERVVVEEEYVRGKDKSKDEESKDEESNEKEQ